MRHRWILSQKLGGTCVNFWLLIGGQDFLSFPKYSVQFSILQDIFELKERCCNIRVQDKTLVCSISTFKDKW